VSPGAGKYDAHVEQILKDDNVQSVILIVLAGEKDSGFSVATREPNFYKRVPLMLRFMADVIDEKNQASANS
jgi:hypothetical protein